MGREKSKSPTPPAPQAEILETPASPTDGASTTYNEVPPPQMSEPPKLDFSRLDFSKLASIDFSKLLQPKEEISSKSGSIPGLDATPSPIATAPSIKRSQDDK